MDKNTNTADNMPDTNSVTMPENSKIKSKKGNKFKTRPVYGLLIILLMAVGLAALIYINNNSQDIRMRASATGVDLSIIPASQDIVANQEFSVQVFINTHDHAVTTAQLELTFDNTKFDFVSLNPGNTLNETLISGISFNNKAYITLGIKPVMTDPGPPPVYTVTPFTGTGNLAELTLKAKAGAQGSSQITFQTDRGDGTGTIILTGETGDTNVVGDQTPAAVSLPVTESPTSTPVNQPSATPTVQVTNTPTPTFYQQITDTPTATPTTYNSPTATATPTCNFKQGDFNHNCEVDIFDYTYLVEHFNETGNPGFDPADLIQDGVIDIYDYTLLVENFG